MSCGGEAPGAGVQGLPLQWAPLLIVLGFGTSFRVLATWSSSDWAHAFLPCCLETLGW